MVTKLRRGWERGGERVGGGGRREGVGAWWKVGGGRSDAELLLLVGVGAAAVVHLVQRSPLGSIFLGRKLDLISLW